MLTITTGKSALKMIALGDACTASKFGHARIIQVEAPSGENEQPLIGYEQTFNGAYNRAMYAWNASREGVAVGIENGIFRFKGKNNEPVTLDMAIILIIRRDRTHIVVNSAGIQFPEEYVKIAEERGFKTTTVGSVIAEKLGGESTDPHSTLTGGRTSRKQILTSALIIALNQI